MDAEERKLEMQALRAQIELLEYQQPRMKEAFEAFVGARVWNTYSPVFRVYHARTREESRDAKTQSSRRKLRLLLHPDKCSEADASSLYQNIERLSDQQVDLVLSSGTPIEAMRALVEPDPELSALKAQFHALNNSIIVAFARAPQLFDNAFVTVEELSERDREHQVQRAKLEEELSELRLKLQEKDPAWHTYYEIRVSNLEHALNVLKMQDE